MIVLDTTVLVYAKGGDHELRDPCRQLIEAVAEERLRATTTVEVVQEFAHVRARRHGRADASALAGAYAELLSPLLPVDEPSLGAGLATFADQQRLGAFDCVLAATCLAAAASLVSADRAFADVDGLTTVFPDLAGVGSLVDR